MWLFGGLKRVLLGKSQLHQTREWVSKTHSQCLVSQSMNSKNMLTNIAPMTSMMMIGSRSLAYIALNTIAPNPGATQQKRRKGRGVGSKRGRMCGRGTKGQKARSGKKGLIARAFEGGQTPLFRRLPKWGFSNKYHGEELKELNLGKLQRFIDKGRLDPTKFITMKELYECNIVGKRLEDGIKLLGRGSLKQPVRIEVKRASESAIKAVEEAGGIVVTGWYNKVGLRALTKPNKFHPETMPRRAKPPPKKMAYYTDYKNRGYLSPEMQLKLRKLRLEEEQQNGQSTIPPLVTGQRDKVTFL